MKHSVHIQGLLLGLGAYVLWAGSDTFNKLASGHGASPLQAMAVCGFVGSIVLVVKMAAQNNIQGLWSRSRQLILFRTASNICGMFCFYTSYAHLPLANAYIIEFTLPFLIALGASLYLHEPLSKRKVGIIAVGFAGAIIAVNPSATAMDYSKRLAIWLHSLGRYFLRSHNYL